MPAADQRNTCGYPDSSHTKYRPPPAPAAQRGTGHDGARAEQYLHRCGRGHGPADQRPGTVRVTRRRHPAAVRRRYDFAPRDVGTIPRPDHAGGVIGRTDRDPRESSSPSARLHHARAPRHALPVAAGQPFVQVAADAAGTDEVVLRHEDCVAEPVQAGDGVHAAARHDIPGPHPHHDETLSGAAIIAHECHALSIGRQARRGIHPQAAGECLFGTVRRGRHRASNQFRPHLAQRLGHPGAPPLPAHAERDPLPGCLLDKARYQGVARLTGDLRDERAAVRVGSGTVGPASEKHRIPRRAHRAGGQVGTQQLRVEAPVDPTPVRQTGLIVRGEAFAHPTRLVAVREKAGGAAEHALQHAPRTAGAVEVEEMRQLVHRDDARPIVVVLERVVRGRRRQEHREPVRRKHRRDAVGRVGVVAQRHVHDAARRPELQREEGVRPLDLSGGGDRGRAVGGTEMHPEMRRVQGPPRARRLDELSGNRDGGDDGRHNECQREPHGRRS